MQKATATQTPAVPKSQSHATGVRSGPNGERTVSRSSEPDNPASADVLWLQRTAGNQAVLRQIALRSSDPADQVVERSMDATLSKIQRDETPDNPGVGAQDLSSRYTSAVQAGDWQAAAEALNGFRRLWLNKNQRWIRVLGQVLRQAWLWY